jgi:cold shock CspA family protein
VTAEPAQRAGDAPATLPPVAGVGRTGTVTAFDEHVGLGRIRGDGGEVVGFHCVAIADGSRTIPVGTAVAYDLAAGLHGRWEAVGIRPVSQNPPAGAPSSPR